VGRVGRPTGRVRRCPFPYNAPMKETAMLVTLLAAGGLFASITASLVYYPPRSPSPPASAVLPGAEDVVLHTTDGLALGAYFVPALEPSDGATIIVFHGNAGDRAMRAPLAQALAAGGFAVLLVDYRGYAGNPGTPSEAGLALDARAARSFLVDVKGVPDGCLVYFGESLGAAVAIELAVDHPPAALILRSPFTSLEEVASTHFPRFLVRLLLSERYPSIERIGRIASPLLVIGGDRDRVVPLEQSRRLYEAATAPKELLVVPGADHNDWELLAGSRIVSTISRFLAVGPAAGAAGAAEPR